jgi:hypothetical protein
MMNRDMLKLRKDPTIPPSAAATVNTSTTNAFPVSPRMGGSGGGDNRGNRSGRPRTSPKGPGVGSNTTPTSASPNTSVSSTSHTMGSGGPAAIGNSTLGSPGYITGPSGSGVGAAGGGSAAGTPLFAGNGGHSHQDASGSIGGQSSLQPSSSSISTPNTFRFDTNGTLWALSASPDYSMVAVVGRDGNSSTLVTFWMEELCLLKPLFNY